MRPYYSKKVIQHFLNPKHFGKMKNADGVGKVGNPRCGDEMWLYIKVGRKKDREIIKDIKFHTLGCAAAISTSDMISDMAKGKTFEDALKIGYKNISDELGNLPPVKIHCAQLAQQGLKAAIEDYRKKKQ
ncbi:MAG: iron-sulfur cluster assembly scaffold protein [Candidatus Nealsonbacteria bacterium CG_4_10_14_0_2_um_filter_38_17]|uniref:Iron-sulfur cluster assembly scaffold protein n=2 Tax=Candidatus Nealsoniibacteriota TaxID=1817911 RepID=A0A2M7UXH8_9BACT|nr:MAG: iron-sulfur cluster assembly scaffold protein [Candidatus Nealsonbacteria bacterium CG23_combo_of_CG06-09_8_20_14_all_38_19]PIZ88660.1 MAG: iron-sulfur cluster assembly scaffold protein [Candidatus Nealsonbacteria bacterium CG_4_10_14_0_2_um_filter_38_17]